MTTTVDGSRTLPVRVELTRQWRRRRTQVTLALFALLPVILWIAFSRRRRPRPGRGGHQPHRPRPGLGA